VNLVQARNKKILERDGALMIIVQTDLDARERELEAQMISDKIARTVDPPLQDYVDTLSRMAEASRDYVRRLLWNEIRALSLWKLEPISDDAVQVFGKTVADLQISHTQLSSQFTLQLISDPGGPQPFSQRVPVRIPISQQQAQRFARLRTLGFSIRQDAFASFMNEIVVENVTVKVEGIPHFKGRLVHLGRHSFRKRDGRSIVEFASPPLYVGIESATGASVIPLGTADQKHFGVSPIADWMLIPAAEMPSSHLGRVHGVQLTFGGRYRATVGVQGS